MKSIRKSMKIIEKSMKIGDKGCPRRGTGHFGPRTADRHGVVGGGRGREVYLLNLSTRDLHALRPRASADLLLI